MAMGDPDATVPVDVDLTRPNAARVYDFLLGGAHHWAIDREFAMKAMEIFPSVQRVARLNREFVQRAVLYLAGEGIRQFLDLGSGIPTAGNVHEIADLVDPGSRVVYVDYEAVAAAHSRYILDRLGDRRRHAFVQHDLLQPDAVWEQVCASGVLDPARPVGLLCGAVLHFLPDAPHPGGTGVSGVQEVMARYRDLLVEGSALALTHVTDVDIPDDLVSELRGFVQLYERSQTRAFIRTPDQIRQFFGGFTLEDSGLPWIPDWHPELEWRPRLQERLAADKCYASPLRELNLNEMPTTRQYQGVASRSCVRGGLAWKR